MAMNGLTWLIVWLALGIAGEGLGLVLASEQMDATAATIIWTTRLLECVWLGYGLYRWRHVTVVSRACVIVIATAAAILGVLICREAGWYVLSIAVVGIWAMSIGFYLGLQLLGLLLSPGWGVCGVARTLVNEAMRMKVPLVFLVVLVILLPVLPLVIDPQDLLKYRIATFLTASMIVVSLILSLLTIFLAARTISNEVTERQIFLTMSKPISRSQYLLGKWLGVVLLDLLLVSVCGVAIYSFTMMLAARPARDAMDRLAVDEQVLVARRSQSPKPLSDTQMAELYGRRLRQLRHEDPDRYGQPDDPQSSLTPLLRKQVQQAVISKWYTIGPRATTSYVFINLGTATQYGKTIQLRIKPKATTSTTSGFVNLIIRINGRPYRVPPLADNNYHVLPIDARMVDPFGKLQVDITNDGTDSAQPSITFNAKDGIEVFYQVGSFEANLVRSMAILWLRLSFLAMLGLAAGSFLSFPVACLLCGLVYVAGATSGFITESLEYYSAFPKADLPWFDRIVGVPSLIFQKVVAGEIWDGLKIFIRLIGSGFMLLIPSFADYNPTPLLSDGRLISMRMLGQAALWIGVVWTGVVALGGYLVFRTRELARVTV